MAGEKILVVDDEKSVRQAFIYAFEEYTIVPAANSEEALDILKRPNDIDLVILDIVMPGLNGIQLIKEIKRLNPKLNIAVFTGYGSKETAIEALRADADEFIEKPFDLNKTRQIIEKLLNRSDYSAQGMTYDIEGKIKKAKEFIKRNYNKTISLKEVAEAVCLSPKYFSRIFKERTRVSFNAFRIGLRIDIAKQLIKKSGYSINQIAYTVGYQNPDSFMKMFKRITGFTPSEFRNGKARSKRLAH